MRNKFCVREFRCKQTDNRQHNRQHATKQVWQNARDNSDFNGFVFHFCYVRSIMVSPTGMLRHLVKLRVRATGVLPSCWYPQQESNLYQGFRKPSFYPVELWGQRTIFYSQILILQVVFTVCIIPRVTNYKRER